MIDVQIQTRVIRLTSGDGARGEEFLEIRGGGSVQLEESGFREQDRMTEAAGAGGQTCSK